MSPILGTRSLILPAHCFPLFLCTVHLKTLSYLPLIFPETLHSVGCIFPFLPCFSLLFFPQLFVKPPQTTILPYCIFPPLWDGFAHSLLYSVYKPMSIFLQAQSLLYLIPWIYSSHPLYNHKGFWFKSYLNGLVVFPTFFSLSMNLALRNSWSESQSAPSLLLLTA